MKTKNIKYLFLFLFAIYACANAQTNYFNKTSTVLGARSAALAEAFVSDAFDVNGMYWNMAGLTKLRNYSILFNHMQEKSINGMSQGIAIPISLKTGEVMAIGLSLIHTGYIRKNSPTEFKLWQLCSDVGYAREILHSLSIGTLVGVRFAKSDVSQLWSVRTSVSANYSPAENISYGLVLNSIGNGIDYSIDKGTTQLNRITLAHSLQAGITMKFPSDMKNQLFSFALANEKIFGKAGLRYKGGLEMNVTNFLVLRGGYIVENNLRFATIGVGIQTKIFSIDYSIFPQKVTNQEMYLSIALNL
ncbi:MAG: hypothetical protein QME58_03080 [Bacteroidota bacterium]|nr:hypothetical protein [Bacteroidota bacterium]